jgi:hypothetical protein
MESLKYTKIEVLTIDKNGSINKLGFEKCFIHFSGNFMIISVIDKNNDKICEVIDLNSVKTYKIYE